VEMGCFRLFLALSVLASHYWFWRINFWMGAYIAVTAFYVISGFYMSLVLDTKYTGRRGLLTFYSNRALRLFPVYWIVLLLTAIANHFGIFGDAPPTVFQMSLSIGPIDRLINIFSNAFLLPSAISVAYDLIARHEITWGPWETLIAGQMLPSASRLASICWHH
jgi:peptidoglycan/LPS O-acetylase OafA/YrhL